MKLTEKQLRNIIKTTIAEGPYPRSEALGSGPVTALTDSDTGQTHRVQIEHGDHNVTISFGPSFTLTLEEDGLEDFVNLLSGALRNM